MKTVDTLIRSEADGGLSFGDFSLKEKKKLADFKHGGDLYKIKTFYEITKLEKNETFVYESVPGSAVFDYKESTEEVTFAVTGASDVQITLELEPDTEYDAFVNDEKLGTIKTNLGGKLVLSIEADADKATPVKIVKA
ncbi:MAG: endosialidase [Lachnospiraceae bacterium]|nr:endosialidase [Lachnospiraceae bacterium]MCR5769233.1 endosialidase [Lachnospiraceae bacterium]